MLTQSQRRDIASRARTLSERLSSSADAPETVPDHVEEWMTAWRDRFEDDEWQSRLNRSETTVEATRDRLASTRPDETPLPDWVEEITDLSATLADRGPRTVEDAWDPETPFVHVLVPIVEYASARIDWPAWLSEAAVHDLESALLDRLRRLFGHPLFVDFKYYLSQQSATADDSAGSDQPSDEQYRQFLDHLFEDGLSSFFHEYAFLARLTAAEIRQWRERVEEFSDRFLADRDRLETEFGVGGEETRIVGIDTLGDAHADGRHVFGLTFASGDRLAYKPRDIGPEHWFDSLVAWSNDAGTLPELRRVRSLPRGEYGWMEWIDSESCGSRAEAGKFYRRVGVLTAFLYALDFSDGHVENLVAAGDHPAVVDLETVAQPVVRLDAESGPAADTIRESVLSTGLIPTYLPEAKIRNAAGLDPDDTVDTDAEVATFDHPNTDRMELRFRREVTMDADHLPTVSEEVVPPAECCDTLLEGFEAGYRFLLSRREELLSADGPLADLADTSVRVLLRGTRDYAAIRRRIRESASLRTGVPFGLTAERLAGGVVDSDGRWEVYEHERRALRRNDVPRFTVAGDETTLRHDGEPVAELADTPPVERVRERLAVLSERDLSEQLDYLRLAFDSLSLSHSSSPATPSLPAGRDLSWLTERVPRRLFDEITEQTRRDGEGDRTWVSRDYRETAGGRGANVRELPDDLYDGRLGIALFGAALAATTGEDRYRELVRESVEPLAAELDTETPYPEKDSGGAFGVGSLVYGFTKLAEILDDQRYTDLARRASTLVTDDLIAADETYDVFRGSAGTILGLLALHDHTGETAPLDRARAAGDHLLDAAEQVDPAELTGTERDSVPAATDGGDTGTVTVWRTIQSEPLCGISHGVGGIAYALERLGRRTGDGRYVETARDAIQFEETTFDEELGNWPDRRTASETDFVRGWCTGRAGIGLTRLGLLREAETDVAVGSIPEDTGSPLARDVRRALDDDASLSDRDHLCCGNTGRIEFLLEAGRSSDGDSYEAQAQRLANAAVQRAERAGRFTSPWATDNWANPTFFAGDAGIGYTLLRLANPDLPCVLLFE